MKKPGRIIQELPTPLYNGEEESLDDTPIPDMPLRTIRIKARINQIIDMTGKPAKQFFPYRPFH